MDNLIIKALLGDEESQKLCTEKGIILPCPLCFETGVRFNLRYPNETFPHEMVNETDEDNHKIAMYCKNPYCCYRIECSTEFVDCNFKDMLQIWNKRHKFPIGRCKTCKHYYPDCTTTHSYMICPETDMEVMEEDFCSNFKPIENNR